MTTSVLSNRVNRCFDCQICDNPGYSRDKYRSLYPDHGDEKVPPDRQINTALRYFLTNSIVTGSMKNRIQYVLGYINPAGTKVEGFIKIIRGSQLEDIGDGNVQEVKEQGDKQYPSATSPAC